MNLEILIIFVIIFGGVCWYFKERNPERKIGKLEKMAYWLYGMSIEKSNSPIVYNITDDDEKRLKETEKKYIRLKEKYKYEPKMCLRLAIDWRDYNLNMHGKVMEWKKFGVNLEESADEEYAEGTKEHQLIVEEIEKRFNKLLES